MRWIKSILLLSFTGIILSCATRNVMRLRLVEQESFSDGGKQIVKQEREGIKVVVSYDGRFEKYMVFDVEVFNNTNHPLIISLRDLISSPLEEIKQNLHSIDRKYTFSYE